LPIGAERFAEVYAPEVVDAKEQAIRRKWFVGGLLIGLVGLGLRVAQLAAPLHIERVIAGVLIAIIVVGYVGFRAWIAYAYNTTRSPGTRRSTTFMFWRLIDRDATSARRTDE
jgi:hypothetical protein